MKRWIDPTPVTVPDAMQRLVGGHTLIAETLVRRGIDDPERARAFLDPAHYRPASPFDLPDMAQAVERVLLAIRERERIAIWGDFDVDGQTATALLVFALRELGADVSYHIPLREGEGHGVNIPNLVRLIDSGVTLVITCDTGIAAHEAIDYASERHVDVIITDHHHLPPTLPQAFAAINPKRLRESHPLRELPGVGVAYLLIAAISGHEREDLLDLVALGIVGDVALQVGDTRYLLQRGLDRLCVTERLGLRAIFEQTGLAADRLTEEHVGFTLAPRLNALGRLGDANQAVELLTTRDPERARILALMLEGLNAERRLQVDQIYGAAQAQIENDPALLESRALVLAHPQWIGGVLGIVANRLAEDYHRPVILLAAPQGERARGSARSVAGIDITAALEKHSDLLLSFGGHTMAAGLSLLPERIPDLRRVLSRTVKKLAGAKTEPTIEISGYVGLDEITPELVADIERLAPFGAGNPPLVLAARDLAIRSHGTVGRGGDHLRLTVEDRGGNTARVIWWGGGGAHLPSARVDLAFVPRMSDYKGEQRLQIEWVDWRLAEGAVEVLGLPFEIVDCRAEPNPHAAVEALRAQHPDLQVWSEAQGKVGVTRADLQPSSTLAIYTIPPSPALLKGAVKRVAPKTVYLFAVDPGMDDPQAFLARLAGAVKFALKAKGGQLSITALAVATAQIEPAVRLGLDWLESSGQITITARDGDAVVATQGEHAKSADESIVKQLAVVLRETAAYRAHFRRADRQRLF